MRIGRPVHGRYPRGPSAASEYSSAGGITADQGKAHVELKRSPPRNLAQGRVPCRPRDDGTDRDDRLGNSQIEPEYPDPDLRDNWTCLIQGLPVAAPLHDLAQSQRRIPPDLLVLEQQHE